MLARALLTRALLARALLTSAGRGSRMLAAIVSAVALFCAGSVVLMAPARADAVRNTEMAVLNALNVQPAWNISRGQGVVVAVIDSGVKPDVSDLTGSVRTGPNLTGVPTLPANPAWGVHGTWMASLIAGHGHAGGGSGIIGVAPRSTVLSIRVITDPNDPGYAAYERQPASRGQGELAKAIRYAVRHGASVISMSLGYTLQSRTVRAALQYAYDKNVVVVASAGNSGTTAGADGTGHAPYSFPANYPGVLAVGAVNGVGQVATFSSENFSVQVAAPGYRVPAQGRDGQYWYVSGTSPACALTAGVVALIKSKYPRLTDSQVIAAITSSTSAASRPPGGYDEQVGFGVVDAAAAMAQAGRLNNSAPPLRGLRPSAHFGGGVAAISAPPVPPRGPGMLILYCLLGVLSLAVVAASTSRMFSYRDRSET